MPSPRRDSLVISGCGVTAAVGHGKEAFRTALLQGKHSFAVMSRPGRCHNGSSFLGAELPPFTLPARFSRRVTRTASHSAQVALVTLHEAWSEARLDEVDPGRIGLIVGGSNLQQRDMVLKHEAYRERLEHLPPTYALSFMDSDLCAICSGEFGIQGPAFTVGGASASGQVAIIQAVQAVRLGEVDVAIALGALADLSFLECQALRSLGAMGSARFADQPARACRPFDEQRDGFIYGEGCGVVVVERAATAAARGVTPYAAVVGWSMTLDANRNPDPSRDGECRAIQQALARADVAPGDIDYVNPHGSGSQIGDATELAALRASGLAGARLNATKSITGHGLSAAGAIEVVATVLQMQASVLHPTRNLDRPIDAALNWVGSAPVACEVRHALTLSMGFGGVNTALVLQRTEP